MGYLQRMARMNRALVAVAATAFLGASTPLMGQLAGDWRAVEAAFGREGTLQPGDVMRFSFPRRDLQVRVGDVPVRPALALGSWVAFRRVGGGHTMVMGDLVLLDSEVNDVISALQSGGVEQSALHNHLLGASPNTMYLHISAHGDEVKIAPAMSNPSQASPKAAPTIEKSAEPILSRNPFDSKTGPLVKRKS